jgi:hypothetical protein
MISIGTVLAILGIIRPLVALCFKLPGWVKEAQLVHGTADGPAKLKAVTQQAMDWYETSYGEVDEATEAVIVQVVAWAVDVALDVFKREGDPAFPKKEKKPLFTPPAEEATDGAAG